MKPIIWDASEEVKRAVQENFSHTCYSIHDDDLWFYPWGPSFKVKIGDVIYMDADGEPYIFNKTKEDK